MAARAKTITPTHSRKLSDGVNPPTKSRTMAMTPTTIRSVFMVNAFRFLAGIRTEVFGFPLRYVQYSPIAAVGSSQGAPGTFEGLVL